MYTSKQSKPENTILLYIALTSLTVVGLVVEVVHAMCILNTLTPVLTLFNIVIIDVYLQCYIESVSLRGLGKPTLRAETRSPNSIYIKAVK